MAKIGFVILHYETIEDTIRCVESIKKYIKQNNYEIVIVDNGSTNGTGEELKNKYQEESRINVIIQSENLGFAKGNNIGFLFCKTQLNCDFIVMLNNDTEILQEDFVEIIQDEYKASNFAVLGPKIILLDKTINPIVGKMRTKKQIRNEIIKTYIKLFLNYLYLDEITNKIQKKGKKDEINELLEKANERLENIVLHGCCLVFSKEYIDKFDGIDERTFLYHEEELLYERLRKNNLKIVYNPKLKIYHKEFSSTKYIGKTERKTNRFRYKNLILSGKILYNDLKNEVIK